jgi:CheY-like chemotaxis protein
MNVEKRNPEQQACEKDSPETGPHSADSICLHFEVKDTGVGIAPEELNNVFDAFVQTKSGQKSQQGTGLGLPISREYVRLMGGALTVESELDVGSAFAFDIQAELVDVSLKDRLPSTQTVTGLESGQPTYRILIAEDDEASRTLLVKLLAPFGFELRTVINGAEAIAMWESWQPHCIFMDLRMPEINGYEAIKAITARSKTLVTHTDGAEYVKPVIIALTASALDEERFATPADGCNGFIRKPFREITIFEALTCHLGVRFTYADQKITPNHTSEPANNTNGMNTFRSQISQLPPNWIEEMRQAILQGDLGWMEALIVQIQSQTPRLAAYLMQYVDNFEYDKMLAWMQTDNHKM